MSINIERVIKFLIPDADFAVFENDYLTIEWYSSNIQLQPTEQELIDNSAAAEAAVVQAEQNDIDNAQLIKDKISSLSKQDVIDAVADIDNFAKLRIFMEKHALATWAALKLDKR